MRAPLAPLVLLRAAATDAALGNETTCGVVHWSIVCPCECNFDPREAERVAATTWKKKGSTLCQKKAVSIKGGQIQFCLVSYPPRRRAAAGAAGDGRRACRASCCDHLLERAKKKREEAKERKQRRVRSSSSLFCEAPSFTKKKSPRSQSYESPSKKSSSCPSSTLEAFGGAGAGAGAGAVAAAVPCFFFGTGSGSTFGEAPFFAAAAADASSRSSPSSPSRRFLLLVFPPPPPFGCSSSGFCETGVLAA